MKADALLTERY